jgi:hypothetical protein
LNKADGHVYSQLLDRCTIPRDLPARKGLARVIAASGRHERERASEWCDERECEGEAIVRVMLYIYRNEATARWCTYLSTCILGMH